MRSANGGLADSLYVVLEIYEKLHSFFFVTTLKSLQSEVMEKVAKILLLSFIAICHVYRRKHGYIKTSLRQHQ